MACILFIAALFNLFQIISPSTETETLSKVPTNIDDAVDGEKFFKNVVNGEKPKKQPDYLLFTAPFRICKGGCSNISNFNMIFPIYVGQKKSQIMYPKIYSEDHQNIYSKADHAPFREKTTRVPFTTCPTCSNDFEEVGGTLPWDHWSWSAPQEPIEYFFRRQANSKLMPIKKPQIACECPPNKECSMEYKFNEDILHFLNIKGLIKSEDLRQLKEDFLKTNKTEHFNEKLVRNRRQGAVIGDSKELEKNCCCPPMTINLPTFITDKRYDDVLERINKIKKDKIYVTVV